MEKKKYLSDVLTADEIVSCKKQKIFIFSGVGSGKNYFVENVLSEKGNILYISSRRAKVDEILFNGLGQERIRWKKEYNDVVTTTNYGIEKLVQNDKFSSEPLNHILDHFDFFVIDEAHSLFTDATFSSSVFHVKALMEYILKNTYIKVILMTGTPEPLNDMFNGEIDDYMVYDVRDRCINVVPKKIELITRETAINYIRNLPENQKTIYYANYARKLVIGKMSVVKQISEENGVDQESIAISISPQRASELNDKYKGLAKLCKETKEYIVEHKKLPDDKKILLTTATLKEGINIKDTNVKIAFCENHILSDIQQFAGRVREGLDTLYIIDDAEQHDVSDDDVNWGLAEILYDTGNQKDKIGALKWINTFQQEYIENKESALYSSTSYEYFDLLWIIRALANEQWSLSTVGSKIMNDYIKFICSHNNYIEFNHIANKFELNVYKYREQVRINKILHHSDWRSLVEEYAKKNNIEYIVSTENKTSVIDKRKIENYLKDVKGDVFKNYDNGKNELLDTLRNMLGLKNKAQVKTINAELEKLNILYTIALSCC